MSTKVKTFTSDGTFNVREEMLKDTKDMLDEIEVTDIAEQCVLLKKKEDEVAALEEKLKAKKEERDDISSRVIPELLSEQGLSEIKLADGSKVSVKKEFRATLPKDEIRREAAYQWLRDQNLGDIIKNNVTETIETEFVEIAQPITGGKDPAIPPLTMFCGVFLFNQIV